VAWLSRFGSSMVPRWMENRASSRKCFPTLTEFEKGIERLWGAHCKVLANSCRSISSRFANLVAPTAV
jgi:hypothetical protein